MISRGTGLIGLVVVFLGCHSNPSEPAATSTEKVVDARFDLKDIDATVKYANKLCTELETVCSNEYLLAEELPKFQKQLKHWVGKRIKWKATVESVHTDFVHCVSTVDRLTLRNVDYWDPVGDLSFFVEGKGVKSGHHPAISFDYASKVVRGDRIEFTAEIILIDLDADFLSSPMMRIRLRDCKVIEQ